MKKVLSLTTLLIMVMLLATGCGRGAAVQNIDNSGYIEGKKVSLTKVENAIKKGAMQRGWMVKKIKSGLLEAQNNVRGRHLVVVEIEYSTTGYKIKYKDSENMKYDAQSNTIHPNYNKWIANLERDINYNLSLIGIEGNMSSKEITTIQPTAATAAPLDKSEYTEASSNVDTQGKTIYIKSVIPYAKNNRIAENIKSECHINQQLAEFIRQYAQERGLTVKYKDDIEPNDLYLNVQIDDAISQGGAFRGHNKFTAISGTLVQGKKSFGSFQAARVSGGGMWGGYKGSCSVLGRTVDTLGKDVATWLYSPINGAKLGDAGYLR